MSKYIIEVPVDAQYIMINGVRSGDCYTQTTYITDIEELTSDYVNEHFGELQNQAYQKGFEDGVTKRTDGDACAGCEYKGKTGEHLPCDYCMNNFKNQWTSKSDKIEVGDEVEVLNSGNKYLIAWFAGTSLCGFAHDGVTCRLQPSDVRKTGRHFNIATILEEMRK